MKCRKCRQAGSPINNLLTRLADVKSVEVLSACSGYTYEGHVNLPEKPFILFSVKSFRTLEKLWQVFSKLSVPTYFMYNGGGQFLFEIDLPKTWPNRNNMLLEAWGVIDSRLREFND